MLLFFLLPLPALLQVVDALLNVTVDDTSSLISYDGEWEPSSTHLSGLDYGGSHTLSSDSGASATFIFTGVAVYYLSPRWPYDVSTRLSLDGGKPVLVNLTDPYTSPSPPGGAESALSSVGWSATGLANTSHTLIATYGNFIIVDGFIYTVDNGSSPISSSSSASSSTSFSSSSTLSSSLSASATLAASSAGSSIIPTNPKALTIGLATAFGLAVFIAGALVAFAFYQRRRHVRARSARKQSMLDDWGSYMRGRGRYAPVATARAHTLETSDASSSRLLYPPSTGRSDPWAPEDVEYQHFSGGTSGATSHMYIPSNASSASSSRRPPPGAMLPAVPGPYMDRVPDDEDEDEDEDEDGGVRRGAALSRAPSSNILFIVHPIEDVDSPGATSEFRISSPPAYSERPGAVV
ncbi:hypothetical protein B0H19DRAFT_1275641 [Mycena capillaripes]|nr:hypothetical protein B0H19DRAFT_1275641 [Mycena capillaripes]